MKQTPEPPRPSSGKDTTPSGIPLEATYPGKSPHDLPGEFPFTRGIHTNMYRGKLWTFRQYAGFGSVEETNRRFRYLLEQGQTGLSIAFDLPTQIGYDSDDSLARGEVGKVGVPISTLEDMEALLDGIPLEDVSISMTINSTAAMLVAFLVCVARKRGVPPEKLRGTVQNDMLKEFISRRTYRFPVAPSLHLVADIFDYCQKELPRWNPISVSGYHMREAGSNATQEVAFTLANAIAYLEVARDRGIPLESFTRRISFFWNAHNHLLEEIAKFRAARRLWAQIVRERFGVLDPECGRMRFHVQTAGSTLSSQEPENNAVRVTIQALAAVLGGTQSLHTNSIDEALGLPSQTSARTALRTQQILAYESGVADVADPLGGAPAVESLTTAVEDAVKKILARIDAMGGTLRAVEEGLPQRAIEEEAYRQQQEIESGERIVVGVNCFREESDGSTQAAAQKVDITLEPKRIDSLRKRKAARPKAKIASLCARLRADAGENKNVLPALIDCCEGGVTIGEMTATLAQVYGEYHE